MSLPNVSLSITKSQWKTTFCVDVTNQLKMLTSLEIGFSKWNGFHLETLPGQVLASQQPYKGAGKCFRTTSLCCALLSNTVPDRWSLLPFPAVVLHQWRVQILLEDPIHGLDASGQRPSEETWPPDVWETELILVIHSSSQVLTERCGCLIGSCWDILLFCQVYRVLGILVRGYERKTQKTPLSYSPSVCWVFSFLWMKSVLYAWDFIWLHFFADHVSLSTAGGRQYLQSALVTLPGW